MKHTFQPSSYSNFSHASNSYFLFCFNAKKRATHLGYKNRYRNPTWYNVWRKAYKFLNVSMAHAFIDINARCLIFYVVRRKPIKVIMVGHCWTVSSQKTSSFALYRVRSKFWRKGEGMWWRQTPSRLADKPRGWGVIHPGIDDLCNVFKLMDILCANTSTDKWFHSPAP